MDASEHQRGFAHAVSKGCVEQRHPVSVAFCHGHQMGMQSLYQSLPFEVQQVLNFVHLFFFHLPETKLQANFVTPPLTSYERRAVHVLTQGAVAQKGVRVHTLGDKTSKTRRLKIVLAKGEWRSA